ncbi:LysM domain protein [Nemania abortiva]|nr:LysM domain protein [Nemania abortiva]
MRYIALALSTLVIPWVEAYLVSPPGTPAPGATADCSAWVQDSYGTTCTIIERIYGMTEAQFLSWNPSAGQLGVGCNLIQGLYYCVEVNYTPLTTLTTSATIPTSTTRATSTTTVPGNGISTPSPVQTGIATNCNKFYLVANGDGCYDIAAAQGITLTDFYAWNPAVGNTCATLLAGYYVCVGVTGSTATTTTTTTTTTKAVSTTTKTSGIMTPTPIQTGIAGNCNAFYLVKSGDSCYDIAAAKSISLNDFYAWNPAVGNTCATLISGYYVCVGISGSATTTLPPTTTKGNGVSTPTPIQTGMVTNCDTFHKVVSGDSCYDIAAAAGIALASFYSWNPAVGSTCATLYLGYYVCIGLI